MASSSTRVNEQREPAAFLHDLVERIHATAPLMVMEFAGAGSQALWLLHSVGGSSRTILEATDRYSPPSLAGAVGFTPKRFTSPEVAAALAHNAARRAAALATGGAPTFGLGLTATIATDRAKRGEHRCELAVSDAFGLTRYGLRLAKGARDRAGEEGLVSRLVLLAVADACGVLGVPAPALREGEELELAFEPGEVVAEFASGERAWLLLEPDGTVSGSLPEDAAILSGSFNPLHVGHLRLGDAARRILGVPVVYELPLVNADKAEIGLYEARRRAAQLLGRAPLLLTRAPLFSEKARLFPGRTFVVGVDTANRLLQPRFYGSASERSAALEGLRASRASFLVAGRWREDRFVTLEELELPEGSEGLFRSIPEEDFREDLSSTQIRGRWPESAVDGEGR